VSGAEPATTGRLYSAFARVYDGLVGDAWFPTVRRSFERVVRLYEISFASAADLGCGTGTFARYLCRWVPVVYGVDRSPAMLQIAAAKTGGSGVRLLRQDLACLRLPERVDLLTCNFDTLNYILSIRTLNEVFARCRACLSSDGHFVFDLILAPGHRHRPETVVHVLNGPDVRARWIISADAGQARSRVVMQYWLRADSGDWRRTTEVHVQRWYPLGLVTHALGRAGFLVRGVHDMETFRDARPETGWAKVVASAA
jgi:SAM-dependent methyltransferase